MHNASKALSEADIREVNHAIDAAAGKTSAKIVPVVATCSGRYDRAEDMVGLWAAALGLALTWALLSRAPIGQEFAHAGKISAVALLPVLGVVVLGFGAGAVLAMKIGWLRRLFVPRGKVDETITSRAKQILGDYYLLGQKETRAAGLFVIYVSLYERAAVILTDQTLQDKLGADESESLRCRIVEGLHQHRLASALCASIEQAAELIAAYCPPELARADRSVEHLQLVD